MNVLVMVKQYKVRPSELIDIADPYTSFCFDEACAYIIAKMEEGEVPVFEKNYSSFRSLYSQYK